MGMAARNIAIFPVAAALIIGGCNLSNPVDDAKKTAALRNVSVSYDSMSVDFGFPQGAVSSGGTCQYQ